MRYTVTAYVNVTEDVNGRPTGMLDGYQPGDKLAEVGTFTFDADSTPEAIEAMFTVGNRMSTDTGGAAWPPDVRSMSVGDVVQLATADSVAWLAVASFGWTPVEVHDFWHVDLAGTNATSRRVAVPDLQTQIDTALRVAEEEREARDDADAGW